MSYLSGRNHKDPITRDIEQAIKEGYFDEDRSSNPLRITPALVLLDRVAMMSPRERKAYLGRLGNLRTDVTMLTASVAGSKKRKKWLSR